MLSEQDPDFGSVLELARALREQVDWVEVRDRTSKWPFGKAFFTLLDELDIVQTPTKGQTLESKGLTL